MELGEEAQREQKRGMLEALGLSVEAVIGDESGLGYRQSSKRVAYERRGILHLGSWVRGTHEGAPMRGCRVDHPRITAAFDELERRIRDREITVYDEASGEGALRYAWAKTDGTRVLLTLFEASEGALDRALIDELEVPDGVAIATQGGRTNAIRGGPPTFTRGLTELTIDGVTVGPLGFSQPNPEMIGRAYDDLCRDEAGAPLAGAIAWDLYAGSGAITRRLTEHFEEVVGVESDPSLTGTPRSVEEFLPEQTSPPDVVVANPPRKGLRAAVTDALRALAPARIHILSCGPEGLARDVAALAGYSLRSLSAYDPLPQTPHVELVAKLVRDGGV